MVFVRKPGRKKSSDKKPRFSKKSSSDFSKKPGRNLKDRKRENVQTKVMCDGCGKECTVPFKPNSGKPIFCDDCFARGIKTPGGALETDRDLDAIHEKLDKIMKALDIK